MLNTQVLLDIGNEGGERSRLFQGNHSPYSDAWLFTYLLF